MKKIIPELNCLLAEVEKVYGRKIKTTTDFEALSVVIDQNTGELLSASTLKRLWGYVSGVQIPRKSTLDILSKFVGKKSFSEYCKFLREDKSEVSKFFSSKTIESASLSVGSHLIIGWAPDRLVNLEYLGDCEYIVRESKNSKLHCGDKFSVGSFMLDFPLYIPALHRKEEGDVVSYVAGAGSGLNRLDVEDSLNH